MLHHSITPILHEISTPAGPNSSIVALQKNIAILTGQYLAASALPQALPSCREGRGGQILEKFKRRQFVENGAC
jgi:hypothetical protein